MFLSKNVSFFLFLFSPVYAKVFFLCVPKGRKKYERSFLCLGKNYKVFFRKITKDYPMYEKNYKGKLQSLFSKNYKGSFRKNYKVFFRKITKGLFEKITKSFFEKLQRVFSKKLQREKNTNRREGKKLQRVFPVYEYFFPTRISKITKGLLPSVPSVHYNNKNRWDPFTFFSTTTKTGGTRLRFSPLQQKQVGQKILCSFFHEQKLQRDTFPVYGKNYKVFFRKITKGFFPVFGKNYKGPSVQKNYKGKNHCNFYLTKTPTNTTFSKLVPSSIHIFFKQRAFP